MTPEQWQKVQEVAQAALDMDSRARGEFIASACPTDAEMRAEVESLIASDRAGGSFIEEAIGAAIETLPEFALPARAGSMIGPYRIECELGRGGTSIVYLGARADRQYEGRVAIKLVRRGLDSPDMLRRFRSEVQILAALDHPNIARLIDAGSTADGTPFFVMEEVKGMPIDRYCDQHGLSLRGRLELFGIVCSAVQHAHRNLIVHRDLKPSNILVTEAGVPKLLDFGIAKLLDSETAVTGTAARMMTPAYASPEQIRGRPASISDDVYSLGVLLYELLCGRRPYDLDKLSPSEAERTICEIEPEKPSAAANRPNSTTNGDSDSIPAREGFAKRLSGDLDNIVMMALRKDRAQRYATVADLAEDVRRYLGGKPVSARRPTLRYRAGKFLRRHAAAVAVVAVLTGLILTLVIGSIIQSRRVARERDRAQRIASFLVELFEVADPAESQGRTITAREILDSGAARIKNQLSDQPEVRASMMWTLGTVYQHLGLYDSAETLLRDSLALQRQGSGTRSIAIADCLNNLSEVLQHKGDFDESESLCREALSMRRELFGPRHRDVARSLANLADVLQDKGDFEAAGRLYREALDMRLALFGEDDADVADSLNGLATLHHDRAEYADAEPLYRRALAIRRKVLGDRHPKTCESIHNLAMLLQAMGDLDDAEPLLAEALETNRSLFGEASTRVASEKRTAGTILIAKGEYARAEVLLKEAVATIRTNLGDSHEDLGTTLHELAGLYSSKGDYRRAADRFREAIAIYRKALPPFHAYLAHPMVGLGDALIRLGDDKAAEEILREALEIRRRALPGGHWRTAEAASLLGTALIGLGRYREAEPLLLDSHKMLAASLGADSARAIGALNRIIKLYEARREPRKANEYRAMLPAASTQAQNH